MKRWLLLAIREMQIKPWGITSNSLEWLKSESWKASIDKDVENLERSYTAYGMQNGAVILENSLAVLQTIKQSYCMTEQFHS